MFLNLIYSNKIKELKENRKISQKSVSIDENDLRRWWILLVFNSFSIESAKSDWSQFPSNESYLFFIRMVIYIFNRNFLVHFSLFILFHFSEKFHLNSLIQRCVFCVCVHFGINQRFTLKPPNSCRYTKSK